MIICVCYKGTKTVQTSFAILPMLWCASIVHKVSNRLSIAERSTATAFEEYAVKCKLFTPWHAGLVGSIMLKMWKTLSDFMLEKKAKDWKVSVHSEDSKGT